MTLTVQSHKEPFHSTGSGTEFFDKFKQANAKFERLNTNEINEKASPGLFEDLHGATKIELFVWARLKMSCLLDSRGANP